MSEHQPINVDQAFDPQARQAQQEFDAYMASRPYQDENGNVHNPDNGQFANADEYFDGKREDHYQEGMKDHTEEDGSMYEDLSMGEVARKLGDAELHDDKTMSEDALEALLEKIDAHVEKAQSTHNDAEDGDLHGAWLDRMMKVKDDYKQKVLAEQAKAQPPVEVNFEDAFEEEQKANGEGFYEKSAEEKAKDNIDHVESVLSDENDGRTAREKIDAALDGLDPKTELSDEDKAEADAKGRKIVEDLVSDKEDGAEDGSEVAEDSEEVEDPITDPSPKGLRKRFGDKLRNAGDKLRDLWAKAGVKAQEAGQKTSEYFNDEEKGKRRKIVAGVLGAAAVLGGAYLIYKGVDGGDSGANTEGHVGYAPNPLDKLSPQELRAFERMVTRGAEIQEQLGVNTPGISSAAHDALLDQANQQLVREMKQAVEAASNAV